MLGLPLEWPRGSSRSPLHCQRFPGGVCALVARVIPGLPPDCPRGSISCRYRRPSCVACTSAVTWETRAPLPPDWPGYHQCRFRRSSCPVFTTGAATRATLGRPSPGWPRRCRRPPFVAACQSVTKIALGRFPPGWWRHHRRWHESPCAVRTAAVRGVLR